MPVVNCPLDNCAYATPDVDAVVAASLLNLHNNVYKNANASSFKTKTLKEFSKKYHPCIGRDYNEEVWNTFLHKREMFKDSTDILESEKLCQSLISAVTKI